MAGRKGGNRRKSRSKFRRNIRDKGKVSIRKYLQSFKIGDKVQLTINPSVHEGLYFPRFHGNKGTIKYKRGECYIVVVNDRNKAKNIVVHPVHLTRIQHGRN